MKKSLFFIPSFLFLIMFSCSTDNGDSVEVVKEEKVSVKFSTGGEISFSNQSMKMAETDDLFALQFYEAETNKPYAHVLGDDISQIKVDFVKDRSYKLKMTYLKNGKNIIRKGSTNEWGIPFSTNYTQTEINHVYYSSGTHFSDISSAYISAVDESLSAGRYVEIDRYHAIEENFLVTAETQQIGIALKRMVFGVTLSVELTDPNLESLRFSVNSTEGHQQVYSIPLTNGKGSLIIPFLSLGFPDLHVAGPLDYGIVEGYTENVHINLGTEQNPLQFYNNKVAIGRNVMAIMSFVQDGTEEGSEGSITFNLEEGELEEVVVNLPSSN